MVKKSTHEDASKIFENISKDIESVKEQIEEIMPSIRKSIDEILSNKITSTATIEQILDQLLDYASMGLGEAEFRRLNQYYTTINRENASFYEWEFEKL